jgi:hypothetical protein
MRATLVTVVSILLASAAVAQPAGFPASAAEASPRLVVFEDFMRPT